MPHSLNEEATLFAYYLVQRPPQAEVVKRYMRVVKKRPEIESKLIAYALGHPHLLGIIDGGLALLKPYAEFRQRLYIMLALLESTPEMYDKFLLEKDASMKYLHLAKHGISAVIKSISGACLLKLSGLLK